MVDTTILGIVTAAYLVLIVFLGYYGYRRTKEAEDYMLAGRRAHPVILALSYGATFISTAAIVGFGGVAANLGMGLIWLIVLNIGVGILLAFIVFGKRTRTIGLRLRAVTFPDFLGKRYGSDRMQSVSGLIIVGGMPLYTAAILIGGARFIETTLSVQYDLALIGFALVVALYVILGGLIAVMYTDAVQGAIMFFGMIILLVLTYALLGGVTSANAELTSMAHLVPEGLWEAGHRGWTSMPELGSSIWLTMITTIVLGVGIGVLAQPQLVVRFMTVKDNRALNRAVMVGGVFILVLTGGAYTVGALTNVYFYREQGLIATQAAGNIDSIIPMYINAAMPDYFVVIFMLALLAAAMSTLSSLFHTMGTSAGYDVWNHLKRTRLSRLWEGGRLEEYYKRSLTSDLKSSFRGSQIGTVVMIVISVILAYLMPGSIIARATAMFFGLCAVALLPAFTHSIYSEKPSRRAAEWSVLVGAISWFLWTAFVHVAESKALGISRLLFGEDAVLSMPWQVVNPLIIALPLSTITLVAIYLAERRGIMRSR